MTAAEAAFTKGGPWLEQLRSYIAENKQFVTAYIEKELPQVKVVSSHANYLMWLDFSAVTKDGKDLCRWIREKTGLSMNVGDIYGGNGNTFARLNVAAPRSRVEDGLSSLAEGVRSYENR